MRLYSTLALVLLPGCRAPVWTAASPSGHFVEVRQAVGGHCVHSAETRGRACFDAVAVHSIAFDRTGQHVAYAARHGAEWTIVRDGTAGSRWSGVGAPRWSADGGMLAYAAERNGRWRLVAIDSTGPEFDAILEHSIVFGARRVGYAAKRGDSIHVVFGDHVSRGWSGAAHLTFDPTGVVAAYAARDHAGWRVVSGDSTTRAHEAIHAVALGPRGQLAYVAMDSTRVRVVEQGSQHGNYDEVTDLQWSGDGRLVYLASVDDSSFIVRDGAVVERGGSEELSDLTVSAKGQLAWVATLDNRMSVGDRVRRDTFDIVVERTLQFVDGERLACLAGERMKREIYVVVDGQRVGGPLPWTELVRMVRLPNGEEALRAWVVGVAHRGSALAR